MHFAVRPWREGMSPVGSPWKSEIFAGSQKSPNPRTPSWPRLAAQAAGQSTRPDAAGDSFRIRFADPYPNLSLGERLSRFAPTGRHPSRLNSRSAKDYVLQQSDHYAQIRYLLSDKILLSRPLTRARGGHPSVLYAYRIKIKVTCPFLRTSNLSFLVIKGANRYTSNDWHTR